MSRRKSLAEAKGSASPHDSEGSTEHVGLKRSLTAIDLVLYGIGSSVGAGIYVLVGLGAKIAGPGIGLSFFLCGTTCILTSLCYAEFASRIPATGSAFIYAYVAFGEFIAFMVGWNLTYVALKSSCVHVVSICYYTYLMLSCLDWGTDSQRRWW